MIHTLVPSDRVETAAVYGRDGQKIGTIERLMLEKMTGTVAYAVVRRGGFLKFNKHHYPVPWNSLKYNVARKAYDTNLTPKNFGAAPRSSTAKSSIGATAPWSIGIRSIGPCSGRRADYTGPARTGTSLAKRSPYGHHRRVSALRLGFCAADLGRHDGGAVRGVLAAARERLVRCGHGRDSRPADAGGGLPKGGLPGPRHHHRCCRVVCDRRLVPADTRAVRDRLRGLARALRLCGRTFGRQQSLRRHPVRLYGSSGRGDADRRAAEHFLKWCQPGRGDRGGNCRARPGQRRVRRPKRIYGPDRHAHRSASAGTCLRARHPPWGNCASDPVGKSAA